MESLIIRTLQSRGDGGDLLFSWLCLRYQPCSSVGVKFRNPGNRRGHSGGPGGMDVASGPETVEHDAAGEPKILKCGHDLVKGGNKIVKSWP